MRLKWRSDFFAILVLLVVVSFVFRGLFQDNLLVSDDYQHHAVRTANYYLALKQGQFPPQWGPNMNQGMGYPAFLYTYHLPYMSATGFHAAGFTIQESVNLAVLFFILCGVIGAFLYTRVVGVGSSLSMILAVAYICNPYILLNVFWRGALGEIAFYSLLPLLLAAIHRMVFGKLSNMQTRLYIVLVGLLFAGLIISHLISLVIAVPLLAAFLFLQVVMQEQLKIQAKFAILSRLIMGMTLGILLAGWYWLPAIGERHLVQFDESQLATIYQTHFVGWNDLFSLLRTIASSDFFLEVVQIGWMTILAILSGLLLVFARYKTAIRSTYIAIVFWLLVIFSSLFLMTAQSEWLWINLPGLNAVQFPWRLLWVVQVANFALLALYLSKFARGKMLLAIFILFSALWSVWAYAQPKGVESRLDFDWYESVETGSSFDEFRPIWAESNYELPERVTLFTSNMEPTDLEIDAQFWTGSSMRYLITTDRPVTVVQKTLYFPGWQLMVNDEYRPIDYQHEIYPGLITFTLDQGSHDVTIRFSESTTLRDFGNILTILGLLLTIGLGSSPLLSLISQLSVRLPAQS